MMQSMMTDVISRSAVLAILENEFNMAAEERAETDDEKEKIFNAGEINCARRSTLRVNELPAIDVVPVVHAHWIKTFGSDGFVSTLRCSKCGNAENSTYIPGNFCWFCGAKMDGEAE